MSRAHIPDAETLSAYVDGELPADRAAHVAALIAEDPKLAAQVSCLHQLKAGVASFADTVGLDLEPLRPAPARRRALWRPAVLGAGLAAALTLAALALWPAPRTPAAPALAGMVAEPFVEMHDAWSARYERGSENPATPHWLVTAMQATGLRLVHAEPFGEDGVHFAFVGSNNCRLSLFEGPAEAGVAPASFALYNHGPLLDARWQAGGRAYVMVARNMDSSRFATIAASLHVASLSRQPPDAELIAVLSAARQRCLV